ncbi:MAG: hypothetical protein HQK55_17015 [Deltaproteobacteria bacterium]|nr:hypothetical protein [Deltaproteobacteria bacterium]
MSPEKKLKAAFIFLAPEANPATHRAWVDTPAVQLLAVAVKDYKEAVKIAQDLPKEGIQAIELCGGFGNLGTAMIVEAVKGQIPVGVVRFDSHPGLGGKSGDQLFK